MYFFDTSVEEILIPAKFEGENWMWYSGEEANILDDMAIDGRRSCLTLDVTTWQFYRIHCRSEHQMVCETGSGKSTTSIITLDLNENNLFCMLLLL